MTPVFFPRFLTEDYAEKIITRREFIQRFARWQERKYGLNFKCTGFGNSAGLFIAYRGVTGRCDGDSIVLGNGYRFKAAAPVEVRRRIDHQICGEATMTIKDVPEREVIRQVKNVIKATGIKLQRINTGCFTVGKGRGRRFVKTAEAGTCDFEGYDSRGRFVAIECKRPVGGRISPAQAARIDDINRAGGVAFVAHSGGVGAGDTDERHAPDQQILRRRD